MPNLYVELPKAKAKVFRALCVESGVAAQVFYGRDVNRIYPKCSPADVDALKEMFAERNGGTAIL